MRVRVGSGGSKRDRKLGKERKRNIKGKRRLRTIKGKGDRAWKARGGREKEEERKRKKGKEEFRTVREGERKVK